MFYAAVSTGPARGLASHSSLHSPALPEGAMDPGGGGGGDLTGGALNLGGGGGLDPGGDRKSVV